MWEEPGYEPPEWVADEPVGKPESVTIPSRILKTDLPALIWAHPDATERSPLLVAHDGPEYAAHSSLLTYLGQLPPLRAALIGPVDRNEIYSASARYSRALAEEILPGAPARSRPDRARRQPRRARRSSTRTAATRTASTPSSSSRAASSGAPRRYERNFPRYERIARFVGGVHRNRPERTIPIVLTCGTVEENLAPNRALEQSLRDRGYDARLVEIRDGHNWVAWRDSFHPHLRRLLQRT